MGNKNKSKYDGFFTKGQTFGGYKVIDETIIIEHEAKVTCQCKCGNIRKVSCYTLINGKSKQCSECGSSLKKNENPAWKGYGDIPGKLMSKLKRDAKTRGIIFNVKIEDLDVKLKKQKYICALTGLKISTNTKDFTASVDRIDSSKGYLPDNIQWVHKDVNMMKRNYSEEYFIKLCDLVVKHHLLNQ